MESKVFNRNDRNLAQIFLSWLILAVFATAALLLPASRAGAQSSGPLPAATPSDQPPPSPRAALPAEIGGKPNLSGTWALNKDVSDDPREVMQQAANASGSRVRVGGGVGGVGGGGGQGGGQGAGGGRRGGQGGGGNAMNDLSRITVEQTPSSAKVSGDSGRVLALYSADDSSQANSSSGANSSNDASANSSSGSSGAPPVGGSADSTSDSDSASAPPAAQWQGTQLVAVTQGRREGSSTTRTYELSPDGKQLFVTTKVVNPRFKGPVTYRLVYDPAPSGG